MQMPSFCELNNLKRHFPMMFWFPLILKHWQHWAITDNDESFGRWTK
jgi:hypothetical protein